MSSAGVGAWTLSGLDSLCVFQCPSAPIVLIVFVLVILLSILLASYCFLRCVCGITLVTSSGGDSSQLVGTALQAAYTVAPPCTTFSRPAGYPLIRRRIAG